MANLAQILTIVLTVLSLWSTALCYSIGRIVFGVRKVRKTIRKEDIFQLVSSLMFTVFSLGILTVQPSLIAHFASAFVAIGFGTLFTFIHFTEYQLTSSAGIKQIGLTKNSN